MMGTSLLFSNQLRVVQYTDLFSNGSTIHLVEDFSDLGNGELRHGMGKHPKHHSLLCNVGTIHLTLT